LSDARCVRLSRLAAAGASLAFGSDSFFLTAYSEVTMLKGLGIFSDADLYKMWVETPGLSIFPDRAIGRLQPGYEASFLVLECNPAEDIACTQKIERGVKQGVDLEFQKELKSD